MLSFEKELYLIYSKVLSNRKQNATLANYRDSILSKLMSGAIEI